MIKKCDNTSVGMIIRNNDGKVLLIERMKVPFGFAPPAGHIDDFGSPEEAARTETEEEVGLTVTDLRLIYEGRRDNPCRREGGDHHYWSVYDVTVTGEIRRSQSETKQAGWYSQEEIKALMERTEEYKQGSISEREWEADPGIEPVWYDLFIELGIMEE